MISPRVPHPVFMFGPWDRHSTLRCFVLLVADPTDWAFRTRLTHIAFGPSLQLATIDKVDQKGPNGKNCMGRGKSAQLVLPRQNSEIRRVLLTLPTSQGYSLNPYLLRYYSFLLQEIIETVPSYPLPAALRPQHLLFVSFSFFILAYFIEVEPRHRLVTLPSRAIIFYHLACTT
jgi:hypothetical protein